MFLAVLNIIALEKNKGSLSILDNVHSLFRVIMQHPFGRLYEYEMTEYTNNL